MTQEHVPPQLTSEGEQLLADVLRRRSASSHESVRRTQSHHDTSAARSNRSRRERDPLRVEPPVTAGESGSRERELGEIDLSATADSSRLPIVAGLLIGAVVLAIAGFTAFSPSPTVATEVAGVTEERGAELEVESAAASSTEPADVTDTVAPDDALVARSVPEVDGSLTEDTATSQTQGSTVDLDPTSIEVIVYDEDPAVNGVHSFALRIKSVSTEEEIDTNAFVVVVVDESGVESQTFSRFIHATLPVGSSALATVRSEGAGPEQQYVVVRVGNSEVARIPIGL